MSKEASEVKPNYGPVYAAALYPDLAKKFVKHGYVLAVHGSVARDFDLIAVPWADSFSTPQQVLDDVAKSFLIESIGDPELKNHGRVAYTLVVGFGSCGVDLSFLNLQEKPNEN